MLSDSELDCMRITLSESLPESGWILRESVSSDGAGGQDVEFARTTGLPLAFRIGPVSSNNSAIFKIGDRSISEPMFLLTFAQDTDIREGEKIETADGERVFIVVARNTQRSYQISTRVVCKEIG